ncbi:MAG: TIR domain-containing protein [Pseudomonadota bacterium]
MVKSKPNESAGIRKRVSQTELPIFELSQAKRIAEAIWENYAGDPTAPHDVAISMDISPTSSAWRQLTGASVAYGLTNGGYNAEHIELTELGQKYVAPQREGEEVEALVAAALNPRIPSEFYKKYDRAKWPKDNIAANVLVGMGVAKDKAEDAVKLIRSNADLVSFIRDTKTGPFVSISDPVLKRPQENSTGDEYDESNANGSPSDEEMLQAAGFSESDERVPQKPKEGEARNQRVFITHGKDTSTMNQIKQVVELGGFEPVISIERETPAKGIPEKVLDDMRSCSAAIIHVSSETIIKDEHGNTHTQLNPNVLIEIGAAMALYRGRFILVVEEGLSLPSNLQGLYQSRYSGAELSFEAGMKILKALRGL